MMKMCACVVVVTLGNRDFGHINPRNFNEHEKKNDRHKLDEDGGRKKKKNKKTQNRLGYILLVRTRNENTQQNTHNHVIARDMRSCVSWKCACVCICILPHTYITTTTTTTMTLLLELRAATCSTTSA